VYVHVLSMEEYSFHYSFIPFDSLEGMTLFIPFYSFDNRLPFWQEEFYNYLIRFNWLFIRYSIDTIVVSWPFWYLHYSIYSICWRNCSIHYSIIRWLGVDDWSDIRYLFMLWFDLPSTYICLYSIQFFIYSEGEAIHSSIWVIRYLFWFIRFPYIDII